MRPMPRMALALVLILATSLPAQAQEARRRWEMQRQIRLDKFEQVLPRTMRDNKIDMWIVAVKENHIDPLLRESAHVLADALGLLSRDQRLAAQVLPQTRQATLWAD